MLETVMEKIKNAILLVLIMSIILGIAYPLMVTAVGQIFFPWQANGSLIAYQDKTNQSQTNQVQINQNKTYQDKHIGSVLIGQYFSQPHYFWGRLSATKPYPYNAQNSSASNLSLANPTLLLQVQEQIKKLNSVEGKTKSIPIDLVTSSASGLDPEISPLAALYQVPRIAKLRNLPEQMLEELIEKQTKRRFLGILGEPRLNVLELNILLDNLVVTKVEK